MPRSSSRQSSSSKSASTPSQPQSQWIMIAEEKLFNNEEEEDNSGMSFCKLRHPKTEGGALYLLCGGSQNKMLCEAVRFSPQFGSWLIGDSVQKDGSMLITTPVDPVFLVLPYLINAGKGGKFMTLDQVVHDEDFPDCSHLLHCEGLQNLEQVADFRGADDIKAYRYNSEKTLAWLALKTDSVAEALRSKEITVGESGAHSVNFVRSKKDRSEGDEAYTKFAFGIVSDYLPLDVASSLKKHLGIKETKENIKPDAATAAAAANGDHPPSKKVRLSKDDITPTEDYSSKTELKKDNSKGKQTIAQKRLSKVDKTGMKSIASFFSPKS